MTDLHDDSIRTGVWRISSHDRTNKSDNTSLFSVDVPHSTTSFRNVLAIQLLSATIPTSFYNIDSYTVTGEDPVLSFYYNGPNLIQLTIPRGQYVIITDRTASPFPDNDLLTVIENLFNTATGSTITWSYDTVKNLLTLTHATNNLEIKSDNLSDANILAKLGFISTQGPATSLTADTLPNISGPQELFIHVSQLSNDTIDLDRENGISMIGNVFVDSPFGSTNHYEIKSSMANLIKYGTKRTIDFLDIRIRNSYGQIINLNNQDFTLLIRAYYTIE
jgi:hypothetical protein